MESDQVGSVGAIVRSVDPPPSAFEPEGCRKDPDEHPGPTPSRGRQGKIALLSPSLREELNRRLSYGIPSRVILSWLNNLPEVKVLLGVRFHGQQITKQNLSAWRLGEFRRLA